MARSVSLASEPIAKNEKALIHSFGVGHGDCTLLEYIEGSEVIFRMLVDGGASLPSGLIEHLADHPRAAGVPQIDVVVLTHVDYDHQGGLIGLLKKGISIGAYWGPCLPAFRRLRGIFKSTRIVKALDTAEELEKQLASAHVKIMYPLEGYIERFCNNRVVISMISPSARLIRRLLTGSADSVAELLSQQPLPLEWMFEGTSDEGEQIPLFSSASTLVTPTDFASFRPAPLNLSSEEIEEQARERLGSSFEPDFFGNAVLNDTSLVMTVDFHIDRLHRRRVLLTGDQENWSYIAYKHPTGLGVDVLKAPHHGGRVYLADKGQDVVDQLYLWLRPRTVVVSASGQHSLPRLDFRNALRRSGATLLCPNIREFEPLSAGTVFKEGAISCHETYGCSKGKAAQHKKITLTLTSTAQSANKAACVQGTGHSGLAPVTVLEQRIVEPDQSFVRWTQTEVEKYAAWIQVQLAERFKKIKETISTSGNRYSDALHIQPVRWSELKQQAIVDGHFNLVANPDAVLAHAVSRGIFWGDTNTSRRRVSEGLDVFRMPSAADQSEIETWLKSYDCLVLPLEEDPFSAYRSGSKHEVFKSCSWTEFSRLLGVKSFTPLVVAKDFLLPRIWQVICNDYFASVYTETDPWGTLKNSGSWIVFSKIKMNSDFEDGVKSEIADSVPKYRERSEQFYASLLEDSLSMLAVPLITEYSNQTFPPPYVDSKFLDALAGVSDRTSSDKWILRELWNP